MQTARRPSRSDHDLRLSAPKVDCTRHRRAGEFRASVPAYFGGTFKQYPEAIFARILRSPFAGALSTGVLDSGAGLETLMSPAPTTVSSGSPLSTVSNAALGMPLRSIPFAHSNLV